MELVIFVGLQGAGKSTFYRTFFAATHALVSKDLLRNNRRPSRRQEQLITAALAAGQSVVVDNTNPAVADRAPLIALGQMHGALIAGYYFDAPIAACLARNRLREGKARVPDVALYTTAAKLVPPAYDEGFDRLFQVSLTAAGLYEVRAVP